MKVYITCPAVSDNPSTKKEFIEAARDVAACTSDLVMAMKNEDPEVVISDRSMFKQGSTKQEG